MNIASDQLKSPTFDFSQLVLPTPAEWARMLHEHGSAPTGVGYDLSSLTMRAAFTPTRTEDLKPGLAALIGQMAAWRWAGVLPGDHSAYPGQDIWKADDARFAGLCVPDKDLVQS